MVTFHFEGPGLETRKEVLRARPRFSGKPLQVRLTSTRTKFSSSSATLELTTVAAPSFRTTLSGTNPAFGGYGEISMVSIGAESPLVEGHAAKRISCAIVCAFVIWYQPKRRTCSHRCCSA